MKHYAVILQWSFDYESNTIIYAITHTYEEAKKVFDYYVKEEKERAGERGWEVWRDDEDCFDASGVIYVENHARLYIETIINREVPDGK